MIYSICKKNFNLIISVFAKILIKNIFGTCLLSKLSIPRLHDEDVSTIATHLTKSKKKRIKLVKRKNKKNKKNKTYLLTLILAKTKTSTKRIVYKKKVSS